METYIVLGNFTEKGMAAIKDSPARAEAARQAAEQAGGRWIGFWLTMGRYDFVLVAVGTDAESAAAQLLAAGMQGFIRTETLRAFSEEEFAAILGNLP